MEWSTIFRVSLRRRPLAESVHARCMQDVDTTRLSLQQLFLVHLHLQIPHAALLYMVSLTVGVNPRLYRFVDTMVPWEKSRRTDVFFTAVKFGAS